MTLSDVRWIDLQHHDDARGTLTVLEGSVLPFAIRRIFYMHGTPAEYERGAHAHRDTQQCAIAVAGAFTMDVSDGTDTATYVLDDPNRALYVPALTWVRLYGFESGTVVLVVCDTAYNPAHVVGDWGEYCRLAGEPSLAR